MAYDILIAVLGSGALSALVGAAAGAIVQRTRKKGGVMAGTRALLYDRIKFLGKRYIADGEIDAESLEDLIEMHRIYHDELSGNGYLDTLMEQVRSLTIKT